MIRSSHRNRFFRLCAFACLVFATAAMLGADGVAAHPASMRATTAIAEIESRAMAALFVRSDLKEAERLAYQALAQHPASVRANFVLMEAAALEGNEAAMLDAALAICEADSAGGSAYSRIAAGRIQATASAAESFRSRIPRLRHLAESSDLPPLRLALVDAASDGASEIDRLMASRDSGLLTDWRIAGPFGKHPYLDFDHAWDPERDGLKKSGYGWRKVEFLQFNDGAVRLPSYLAKDGVFYASSDFYTRSDGEWRIFLESAGTLEISIDGRMVLSHDDRRQTQPLSMRGEVNLSQGTHHVLVKFLSAAAPFRLAIMTPTGGLRPHPNIPSIHASDAGGAFVSAALHYWEGDLATAAEALTDLVRKQPSASAHFLLAKTWATVDDEAPEQLSEYEAALSLSPGAAAAELAAAGMEFRAHRLDAALPRLQRLLPPGAQSGSGAVVPASELPDELQANPGALALFADVARSLGWQTEEEAALRVLVKQRPSCENLRRAAEVFLSYPDASFTRRIEQRLEDCDPLAFARVLSDEGNHAAAARVAAKAIRRNATDRAAREFTVRELMLAGMHEEAAAAARELQALAPNSESYRKLASQAAAGATVFSRNSGDDSFYSQYRRNADEIVARTAKLVFSGGPFAILLNDRVLDIQPDGSRRVYVHLLTRVLNRDGVEQNGEVSLPAGAHILQLRTLKADGPVVEPELTSHKQTISMPALAPGDIVEQEFFLDHAGNTWNDFVFGSFDAPTAFSRFVAISPAHFQDEVTGGASKPRVAASNDGRVVREWVENDLKALRRERNLPEAQAFPAVSVRGPEDSLDEYAQGCREAILEASRPGVRTTLVAYGLNTQAGHFADAHTLDSWIKAHVQPSGGFDCADLSPAEETLQSGTGSRLAAFLALARVSGIRTEILLARKLGAGDDAAQFSHPVLLLSGTMGAPRIFDPEAGNLPFGVLPISLDRENALPIDAQRAASARDRFTKLPPQDDSAEQSRASGDLTLSSDGELRAALVIRLGATRGAQLRGNLRGGDNAARQRFLEQLAERLLPGAIDVSGSVEHAEERDRILELRIQCRVPAFLEPSRGSVDLDQLVPGLGLGQMYASSATRSQPMLIDEALFESSNFKLHMPAEVALIQTIPGRQITTRFGSYHLEMATRSPHELEITREFSIPAQLVSAADYAEFRGFAAQIDQLERERITMLWEISSSANRMATLRH